MFLLQINLHRYVANQTLALRQAAKVAAIFGEVCCAVVMRCAPVLAGHTAAAADEATSGRRARC